MLKAGTALRLRFDTCHVVSATVVGARAYTLQGAWWLQHHRERAHPSRKRPTQHFDVAALARLSTKIEAAYFLLNSSFMSHDDPPAPDLMTIDEVAQYLHVNRSTVLRLLKTGSLPGFKVARSWRFHRREIDDWIIARTMRKPP
jgi:excisionase family DNA binding protein